jgi:hypothetical protein
MNSDNIRAAWNYFAILIIASVLSVIIYFIVAPKKIIEYHLKGGYNGAPAIGINIDNSPNETIYLGREVSWKEAVQMVDSLNYNLKNK